MPGIVKVHVPEKTPCRLAPRRKAIGDVLTASALNSPAKTLSQRHRRCGKDRPSKWCMRVAFALRANRFQNGNRARGQWNGASIAVLGVRQVGGLAIEVNILPLEGQELPSSHGRFEGELEDARLGRAITFAYGVEELPIVS